MRHRTSATAATVTAATVNAPSTPAGTGTDAPGSAAAQCATLHSHHNSGPVNRINISAPFGHSADSTAAARVPIKAVQGGELDLSTSARRMVARILGSVSRQGSEHKGERQVRGNRQKAEAGTWQTSKRPFGHTMKGEPHEPEATALRAAVADVLGGKSLRRLAVEWNEAGIIAAPEARPGHHAPSRRCRQTGGYPLAGRAVTASSRRCSLASRRFDRLDPFSLRGLGFRSSGIYVVWVTGFP